MSLASAGQQFSNLEVCMNIYTLGIEIRNNIDNTCRKRGRVKEEWGFFQARARAILNSLLNSMFSCCYVNEGVCVCVGGGGGGVWVENVLHM